MTGIGIRFIDENELRALVSGRNKAWLTRIINKQKTFGNYNCIEVEINSDCTEIEFDLGESWGIFKKELWGSYKNTWQIDYGNLYFEEKVTSIVNELAAKLGL